MNKENILLNFNNFILIQTEGNSALMVLVGDIDVDEFAELSISLIYNGIKELKILISSNGGNPYSVLSLYATIIMCDIKLTTYNTSYSDSAAMKLFMMGDKRIVSIGSRALVHKISYELSSKYTIKKMKEVTHEDNVRCKYLDNLYLDKLSKEQLNKYNDGKDLILTFKSFVLRKLATHVAVNGVDIPIDVYEKEHLSEYIKIMNRKPNQT